jgi:hypothetical protein
MTLMLFFAHYLSGFLFLFLFLFLFFSLFSSSSSRSYASSVVTPASPPAVVGAAGAALTDEPRGLLLMEGWLFKEGGSIKSWKRRYFELVDTGTLSYFHQKVYL